MRHGDTVRNAGPYRLRFFVAETAMCGIPGMADARISGETRHIVFIENIPNQADTFFGVNAIIISHNPRRILATML